MLRYMKLSEYSKCNELLDDFVSIVTSFCDCIYGRKRENNENYRKYKIRREITNET